MSVAHAKPEQVVSELPLLVEDWHRALVVARKGDAKRYRARVVKIVKGCGWQHAGQMNLRSFDAWFVAWARERSASTQANHIAALTTFCSWLLARGLIESNWAKAIQRPSPDKGDGSRAMTPSELLRLIRTAEAMEAKAHNGQQSCRSMVYRVSAYCGLRWLELRKLKVSMVNLAGVAPTIYLDRIGKGKNRKKLVIPLHAEAVAALLPQVMGKKPDDLVFETMPDSKRFDRDLRVAGIAKHDERGRSLSFHGLRKTFATNCARFDVNQRVTQSLMRHQDPKVTANIYQDAEILPLARELGKLPSLRDLEADSEQGKPPGRKNPSTFLDDHGEMSDTGGAKEVHVHHHPQHDIRKPGPRRTGRLSNDRLQQGRACGCHGSPTVVERLKAATNDHGGSIPPGSIPKMPPDTTPGILDAVIQLLVAVRDSQESAHGSPRVT